MKVIIQLQYSLTDSRVFHDIKNITQSSLHPTHQKLKKLWPNPTQPMDGPNPWPTLRDGGICALPSVRLVSVGVQEGDAEGAVVVDANPWRGQTSRRSADHLRARRSSLRTSDTRRRRRQRTVLRGRVSVWAILSHFHCLYGSITWQYCGVEL